MNRLTKRDKNRLDIIGLDKSLIIKDLDPFELGALNNVIDKLADFEDLCEEMQVDGARALRNKLFLFRFIDGYDEETRQEVRSVDFMPYCEEYTKINKRYIRLNQAVRDFVNKLRQKYQERPIPSIITLSAEEVEEFFKRVKSDEWYGCL